MAVFRDKPCRATRQSDHLPVLLLIIRLIILEGKSRRPLICARPLRKSPRRGPKQHNPQTHRGQDPISQSTNQEPYLDNRGRVPHVTVDQAYALPERQHPHNRHSVRSFRIIVVEADGLSNRGRQRYRAGEEENNECKYGKAEAERAAEVDLHVCGAVNFGCKQCDHEFGHDDQKASLEAEPARCAVRVGIEHLLEIRVDVLNVRMVGRLTSIIC